LHEDAEGALWIGTDKGLSRLCDGRITTATTALGLPDNLVNFILEDDMGNLWVSHDRGIYRVRRDELNAVLDGRAERIDCISYDIQEGLPSIETNGQNSAPAGLKARDGRLWFPTTGGVVVFNPSELPDSDQPPAAAVEEVQANGRRVLEPGFVVAGGALASGGARFELPPGSAHTLEFRFAAADYSAPEQLRFEHRLIGVDEDWIEAGTTRKAYYTNLKPGHYCFEVKARNKYGVWSTSPASFSFIYLPHFHQTLWFRGSCGVTVLGILWLGYRHRLHRLDQKRRLENTEALLRERERIARDLHDGLGANLTQLVLLSDLGRETAPDAQSLQSRFLNVSRSTHEALHAVKELIWTSHPVNDSLESLANRVCLLTERLLSPTEIQLRLEISQPFPDRKVSAQTRHSVLLAAKEALNNILKHSAATRVTIHLLSDRDLFTLRISDNGRGLPAAVLPRATPWQAGTEGGHGLRNMRLRIEERGGRCDLESQPGTGLTVVIRMPFQE
jgi:signal transduction histidine kinase